MAPEGDLVFVELGSTGPLGQAELGDSVALLEALDFIARTAGPRPWVANLSVGRQSGAHDGSSLVEQGLDAALLAGPGRAVTLSTGNYYESRCHAPGQLGPGQARTLTWETDPADVTPNEMDIRYDGLDVLVVEVRPPGAATPVRVSLGESAPIRAGGREVGRIYHRPRDPNNADHHVNIFLDPGGPAGAWQVTLVAEDVVDGRFHAWIERDAARPGCQSRFGTGDAVASCTTGTTCNSLPALAVGAYDPRSAGGVIAPSSSAGPTRDGRRKPDLVAPGVAILAPRSAPRSGQAAAPYTRMSGTSMAAPHVAGAIALMFEAAERPLRIDATRRLLLGSARAGGTDDDFGARIGAGRLDAEAAVEAARRAGPAPDATPQVAAAGSASAALVSRHPSLALAGATEGRRAMEGETATLVGVSSGEDCEADDPFDDPAGRLVELFESVVKTRTALLPPRIGRGVSGPSGGLPPARNGHGATVRHADA